MLAMSKRKASYDLSFKLKAGKCAEKKTKEAAGREFKVNPRRIREWCQQKEKLVDLKKQGKFTRKRLEGRGHEADDEVMEDVLFAWIVDLHGLNPRVSLKMIQAKAKELSTSESFTASQGWLHSFLN